MFNTLLANRIEKEYDKLEKRMVYINLFVSSI